MLDTLFYLSFLPALPFWMIMIFAPDWKQTHKMIASPWVLAPVALLYTLIGMPFLPQAFGLFSNLSLESTAMLFGTPEFTLIIWLHFIAIDLTAGRWIYLDSRSYSISRVMMALILLTVMMLAPFGILLYLIVRQIYQMRQQ